MRLDVILGGMKEVEKAERNPEIYTWYLQSKLLMEVNKMFFNHFTYLTSLTFNGRVFCRNWSCENSTGTARSFNVDYILE